MFVLMGNYAYDGDVILGVFDDLELAKTELKKYRKEYIDKNCRDCYDSYHIFEIKLNTFYEYSDQKAVYYFNPNTSKWRKK